MFNLFKPFDLFKIGYSGSTYNPLINYDWSTTTTSGLRYLRDVGSTPTYNASMYFGRGAYLNGVDQTIAVPINTIIQTSLKRVNGVVTINETSQILTNYVISGLGVHKDYYLFTRLLTPAEKDSYTNTPELFYAMAQADNTCVLNMPMCETSSTARNYKTGIDYPIINYTSSVRDNAKNLQYGLQTCKFVRDSLGVIQSASDYLEGSGVGYANTGWIPSSGEDWTIECGFIAKMDNVIKRMGCGWTNSTQVIIGESTSNRVQAYVGNKQAVATITNPNVEIILIKSNGYALVYINKVQIINELIGLPFSPDEAFRLSGHRLWSVYPWNNTITKFKVHNKALTNEEIQIL